MQEERLAAALGRLLGADLRIEFEVADQPGETPVRQRERDDRDRIAAARLALDRDPNVIALKERFDAVVQPDSVRPVR
jgi:DNA polymerase-3 subunit gamma/tau